MKVFFIVECTEGIAQYQVKRGYSVSEHGLRTPNEGRNQRNLKFWANVADKICFGRIYKFGIGI